MKRRRQNNSVNGGAMADIAFLLLIFFLVSTSLLKDQGIKTVLPIFYEGPIGKEADRNVFDIKINKQGQVLIESQLLGIEEIDFLLSSFVFNRNNERTKPLSPSKAVISIQHDPDVEYVHYIKVYDQVKRSIQSIRNDYSLLIFDNAYSSLNNYQRQKIKTELPLYISEAEYQLN